MVDVSRRHLLRITGAGVGLGSLSAGIAGGEESPEEGDPGHYIVGTMPGNGYRSEAVAANVHRTLDFGDIGEAICGSFPASAIRELEADPNVRYVERNGRVVALGHTVDENESDPTEAQVSPWGIDRIGALTTHHVGATGDGASLAIIDSGIDPHHETLAGNLGDGWTGTECDDSCVSFWCPSHNDIEECFESWDDDADHGTHVAGIAGAVDNAVGVVGVAPAITLHPVKVLDCCNEGTSADLAAAIEWVADRGIDVANLSLSGNPSEVIADAVAYAWEQGVLLVAAAGNEGPCSNCVTYPAAAEEVIAVSATDDRDELASFSSTGDEIDLAAPGADVLSSVARDGYHVMEGTSMAGPHVAGLGAILMGLGLDNAEARDRILQHAEDLGLEDSEQGAGLVNVPDTIADGLTVATGDPVDIDDVSATIAVELVELPTAEATVEIEWREADGTTWHEGYHTTLSEPDEIHHEVTGLTPGVEYELRSIARTDGRVTYGGTTSFITAASDISLVRSDEVTDRGPGWATLSGDLEALGPATEVTVGFEWRAHGSFMWTRSDVGTVTDPGSFATEITDLEPGIDYEWRAIAEDPNSVFAGESEVFTSFDPAVEFHTKTPAEVSGTQATLTGELADMGDHETLSVGFEWREKGANDWHTTETTTLSDPGPFEATIVELTGDTAYEYRAVAHIDDDIVREETVEFQTDVVVQVAITTTEPTEVGVTSATLTGTLDLEGVDTASVHFEYRPVRATDWQETPPQDYDEPSDVRASIDGLDSGILYEYRAVVAFDDEQMIARAHDFSTTFEPCPAGYECHNDQVTTEGVIDAIRDWQVGDPPLHEDSTSRLMTVIKSWRHRSR